MEKLLFFSAFLFFSLFSAQRATISIAHPQVPPQSDPSLVIFGYDEAGNQIFRGPTGIVCNTCRPSETSQHSLADQVANSINAAPVPVKEDLTVIWKEEIKDYIVSIDLLPYNAFRILKSVSIKSLDTNSYVFEMGHLPYGVYYLKFNLSDGSVYTRTVTKN